MRNLRLGFIWLLYFTFLLGIEALKFHRTEHTERISGNYHSVADQ